MSFVAIAIGCVTGFVSAFFGIGGSSIDTPLLRTFLDLPPYIALGSPLPTAFLTVLIALATYWKKHLVNFRIFRWSILGGIPGVMLGSYLSKFFPGKILMLLTACVLFLVGIDFVYKIFNKKNEERDVLPIEKEQVSSWKIFGVTSFVSVLSGILAIGGGLFLIPSYILLFGLKIKEAIATSLLTVAVMVIPATLIHYQLGHIDLGISASMGLGVIPMAYLGAKLDLKTDSNIVQLLFGCVLLLFSIYFFVSQI